MPKTYEVADAPAKQQLADVMEEFEVKLHSRGVTVELLFAYGEELENGKRKPAIVKKGVRSIADIKINPYRDRVEGKADATIRYDHELWARHLWAERRANLHHELHHLMFPEGGEHALDLAGRPLLKMRPHDYEVGWFAEIARIHGPASTEVKQVTMLTNGQGQLVFPWFKADAAPAPAKMPAAKDLGKGYTATLTVNGQSADLDDTHACESLIGEVIDRAMSSSTTTA